MIIMNYFNLNDKDIKELKTILGEDYQEISEFYYKACTIENYEYKIFLTRRSYVLYRIFVAIFKKENPNFKVQGEVYNSHSVKAMNTLIDKLDRHKILVLDDIIINGRTVNEVFNELKAIFANESLAEITVKIWCIVRNSEAKCIENISDHFGHYRYVTPDDWRKLSDKLTEFIVASNIGYVSFVDTYYIDADYLTKIESRFSDLERYSSQCELFDKAGVQSNIIYYSFSDKSLCDYNLRTCVRLYAKGESITVIPYVFLPVLLKKQCKTYCTSLLSRFCIKVPDVLENQGNEVLLYQWTINQLSNKLFDYFCRDLLGYRLSCDDSFKMFLPCSNEHLKSYRIDEKKSKDVKECCEIFENTVKEHMSHLANNDFEFVLEKYLGRLHNLDENRAKTKLSRHKGIKIQDILEILNNIAGFSANSCVSENQILSAVINSWDTGKSSYVIAEDETSVGDVIAGFIRNGEQAYRIVYEQHNFQYRVFYDLFLKKYICDEKTVTEIANALDRECKTTEFNDFCKEINFDNYFSDLLSVEPIIKNEDEQRFEEVKQCIVDYINRSKKDSEYYGCV